MSASLLRNGTLEPPVSTALSSTSATTVVTGLSTYLKVVETIILANVDAANACVVSLHWVDATPTSTLLWKGEVAAQTTVILDNIPIVVSGKGTVRSITATAAAAADITVTVITSMQASNAG